MPSRSKAARISRELARQQEIITRMEKTHEAHPGLWHIGNGTLVPLPQPQVEQRPHPYPHPGPQPQPQVHTQFEFNNHPLPHHYPPTQPHTSRHVQHQTQYPTQNQQQPQFQSLPPSTPPHQTSSDWYAVQTQEPPLNPRDGKEAAGTKGEAYTTPMSGMRSETGNDWGGGVGDLAMYQHGYEDFDGEAEAPAAKKRKLNRAGAGAEIHLRELC